MAYEAMFATKLNPVPYSPITHAAKRPNDSPKLCSRINTNSTNERRRKCNENITITA
jgi:hypothetical protein